MIYIARPTELAEIPLDCWECPYGRTPYVVEGKCIQTGRISSVRGCRPEWCPLVEGVE
jgi:hypothetical protein